MKGLFISFEGIEGCGKSTQIELLNRYLGSLGIKTLLTREPGGTDIGERIREILMDSKYTSMSPVAELLLYAASRNQHIFEKIGPAIDEGIMVLCDRYADATTAYQGAARRLSENLIAEVHLIATSGLRLRDETNGADAPFISSRPLDPDLTFLLDCPAGLGLSRAKNRNLADPSMENMDRFEMEEMDFHERVRDGYLAIAKKEPQRVVVIDATGTIDQIHAAIIERLREVLKPS